MNKIKILIASALLALQAYTLKPAFFKKSQAITAQATIGSWAKNNALAFIGKVKDRIKSENSEQLKTNDANASQTESKPELKEYSSSGSSTPIIAIAAVLAAGLMYLAKKYTTQSQVLADAKK